MKLKENAFLTKKDYQDALEKLIDPLRAAVLHSELSGVRLGSGGAVYDQQHADMEALIRPLWGLAPYWTAEREDELKTAYLAKLKTGTDPLDEQYWGAIEDYDQYIVEMAALSLTLLLHKDCFWEELSKTEQSNMAAWLSQALERKIPKNNWTFFKVLIRTALFHCDQDLDKDKLHEELELIDSMYLGEGWYCDGKVEQRDYYIPFAFHYYGLIFATFMKQEEPVWAKRFIERATLFAQDFIYYFDASGEALPYGRSLIYRFAQGAFFSALVFADVEAIPWEEVKMLLSSHMQTWMNHSIFTFDGRLSVGYHYENGVMTEGYNSPGSPYWAMKTFLLLAVKEDHPFWQVRPRAISRMERKLIKKGNMLLLQEKAGEHLLGFPAGMMIQNQAHGEAKYSKFVYSTKFGFSVPKAGVRYEEGAYDSTLAVSTDGRYFRTKGAVETYRLTEDRVSFQWFPFEDVQIHTEIYPFGQWHLRVHEIHTEVPLEIREGGFSLPLAGRRAAGTAGNRQAAVTYDQMVSRIIAVEGYDEAQIIQPEPNTSVFFPRSSMVCLMQKLMPGKHRLMCLVGGLVEDKNVNRKEEEQ